MRFDSLLLVTFGDGCALVAGLRFVGELGSDFLTLYSMILCKVLCTDLRRSTVIFLISNEVSFYCDMCCPTLIC